MLGRYYTNWGSKDNILYRFGDNRGFPFVGPIQTTITTSNRLVIFSKKLKIISVQNLIGTIEFHICPEKEQERIARHFLDKAYELVDEDDQWREKYLANEDDENIMQNQPPQYYLDLRPVCISGHAEIPLLAVIDERNCIKIVDLESHEVTNTFGRTGIEPGEMMSPSAIHLFKIGRVSLVALGDSGMNQRVTVFDSSGTCLLTIGSPGPLPRQFRDITSIATFPPPSPKASTYNTYIADVYDREFMPDWYKGNEYTDDELIDFLLESNLSSNFVIGQFPENNHHYVIHYITSTQSLGKLYIVFHSDGYHEGYVLQPQQPHNQTLAALTTGLDPMKTRYKTIFHLLQSNRHLFHLRKEFRASCLVAVCDQRNFRIQIFRYYWTKSFLYHPEFHYITSIGGMYNQFIPLTRPSVVNFVNPGGELAIVDAGNNNIFLLSSNYMLIKIIHLDYFSDKELTFYRLQQSTLPVDQELYQKFAKRKHLICSPEGSNEHRKPCSVEFTSLGHLIVGYQSGGIYVYQSNSYSKLGALSKLETGLFEKIVCNYLTYTDLEALRGTCRYLHHFTRDLRLDYKIFPKVRQKIFNKVIYLFLKWARVGKDGTQNIHMEFPSRVKKIAKHGDDVESLIKSKKKHKPKYNWDDVKVERKPSQKGKTLTAATDEPTTPAPSVVGAGIVTTANGGVVPQDTTPNTASSKRITKFTRSSMQMNENTNADVAAMVLQASLEGRHGQVDSGAQKRAIDNNNNDYEEEIDHFELRQQEQLEIQSNSYFSLPSQKIIILRDRLYNPICKYHLQLLCPLAADRCADSHDHIVYNRKEIQETGGYLLYDDLFCFLSEIFDMKYVWKYEEYIKELFTLFAHEQELCVRTDPMSRKNEVIRPTVLMKVPTLRFYGYLELIVLLEENMHGYKSILDHKLFAMKGRDRFIPRKAISAIENRKKQPNAYVDPTKQYDPANIPLPPLKSLQGKQVFTKEGMENSVREIEEPVKAHLEVFLFQAEKASSLINKLFS